MCEDCWGGLHTLSAAILWRICAAIRADRETSERGSSAFAHSLAAPGLQQTVIAIQLHPLPIPQSLTTAAAMPFI